MGRVWSVGILLLFCCRMGNKFSRDGLVRGVSGGVFALCCGWGLGVLHFFTRSSYNGGFLFNHCILQAFYFGLCFFWGGGGGVQVFCIPSCSISFWAFRIYCLVYLRTDPDAPAMKPAWSLVCFTHPEVGGAPKR